MYWTSIEIQVIVFQYLSSTKSNSFILDVNTNQLLPLNGLDKEAIFMPLAWDKTGNYIYLATDEGKEFKTLTKYEVKTGKLTYLTDNIPWDVENFVTNADRTKAAFTVNENGYSQLYILDMASDEYAPVPDLPIGQIYALKFHPDKDELGMVLNTTQTPGDVYSINLNTMQTQRWTTSEVGGLNTETFPTSELIMYDTYDEVDGKTRQIPAFVYKPQNAATNLPVMISIHGGPEGQHIPFFSSFYAFLANEMGIAVIAPNVRGSSGYGKNYLKLDNGFKRENSVKDIGKLIEWIENNPDYDKDRIAVFGGSYGGYMVLASMFKYNDKLKCGIDIVGISNFVTFLENTEEYRRDLSCLLYTSPSPRDLSTSRMPSSA